MPPKKQNKVRILIELLVMFFSSGVMVYGGTLLVMMTAELKQTSAALGLNMGLIYLAVPLSGVLIVMFTVDNIYQLIRKNGIKSTIKGEI